MKQNLFCLIILGLAVAISLTTAQAQDLAQLAKKTREERMKAMQQRSVRVWNNDNIPKHPAGAGPTAAGGMAPVAPVTSPSALPAEPPPIDAGAESDAAALDSMRDKIKAGQQNLQGLEESLRLAEDELSLLQVQQASELAPETQSTLATQIKDKNAAVSGLRQEIDKAKKDLEGLKNDFKAQGGTLEEKKK